MSKFFWFLVALFLLTLTPSTCAGQSDEHKCSKLIQEKSYIAAGRCYVRKIKTIEGKGGKWTLIKKLRLGLIHSQLTGTYKRLAKVSGRLLKPYWLEQAMKTVQRSIKRGYCGRTYRCRMAEGEVAQLRKQIGYSTLTVVANSDANITVTGFKFEARGKGSISKEVRPGWYAVTVRQASGSRKTTKYIKRHSKMTLNMTAEAVRVVVQRRTVLVEKKLPKFVIAGYAVGAAVALAGIVVGVYGVVSQGELNRVRGDPDLNHSISDKQYAEQFQTAQIISVVGWVGTAVGAGFVAGAVGLHVANSGKGPRKVVINEPLPPMPSRKKSFRILSVDPSGYDTE